MYSGVVSDAVWVTGAWRGNRRVFGILEASALQIIIGKRNVARMGAFL